MRQFNNIYCFWEEEIWNFNKLEYILWPNFKMELKLLNLIHWFIRKCFKCEKFRVTNGNKVRKISLVWHIIHCPRQWTYWPYYFFHQSPIVSNLMLHQCIFKASSYLVKIYSFKLITWNQVKYHKKIDFVHKSIYLNYFLCLNKSFKWIVTLVETGVLYDVFFLLHLV